MRASRAGRTGGSWYGSYEVTYRDPGGLVHKYATTNRRSSERAARKHVHEGATLAEVRDNHGVLMHVCNGRCADCADCEP